MINFKSINSFILYIILLLIFLFTSAPARAQGAPPGGVWELWQVLTNEPLHRAIEILRREAAVRPGVAPLLDRAYLHAGRWDLRHDGVHFFETEAACSTVRETAWTTSAVEWLDDRLAATRVLMLNENHADPGPRWFLREILPRLRERGFRHLALEALDPDRPLGPREARLSRGHGWILDEPLFAGMIREALKLGFAVFGYDRFDTSGLAEADRFDRILARERGQAETLIERLARIPEEEKLIILGGLTHITEDWHYLRDGRRLGWMAAQFTALSGLDPLTVDLTGCPVKAGRRADITPAQIHFSKDGTPLVAGPYAGRVDAQFHIPGGGSDPGTFRHSLGRPWHAPADAIPRQRMILLEAFAGGAPAGALPHDRVLLDPGENFPLFLPTGRYMLHVTGRGGDRLATIDVVIPSEGL